MDECPDRLNGAKVLLFSPIDERHTATNRTCHSRDGERRTGFAGLAGENYPNDPGCYLFYCDKNWIVMNGTYHDSIDQAKSQAEWEFEGTAKTWKAKTIEQTAPQNEG